MSPHLTTRQRWTGRLIGAVAMLAFLALSIIGREWLETHSLLDTLADGVLLFLPVSVFSWFLDLFGSQAKTLLLIGIAVALVVVGAWLGGRLVRTPATRESLWQSAMITSGVLFLVLAGFVFIVDRESSLGGGLGTFYVWLGIASVAFGALLAYLIPAIDPTMVRERYPGFNDDQPNRRTVIGWAVAGVASLLGLALVTRDAQRVATREVNAEGTRGELSPAITPNDDFYVISKNFIDPGNDRGPDWSIQVDGLVDTPLTLFRADLEALGEEPFISTQLCISNSVGGDLIGTAEWSGVPIAKVLDTVGVQDDAYKVIFEGVDGYTTAVPVERVRDEHAHIIWLMNGEPLPENHGAPVRAVIPGLYGMKSVKWLTKMTLTAEDYKGYWETRNWTDDATVKTMSRIDVPRHNDVLNTGIIEIGGVAFAGDRGVSRVEVSTDDGATWHNADIVQEPNPDGIAWVIWTYQWRAAEGEHPVVVRAVEADGTVQTEESASELPDGASGWHRIRVGVV